MRLSLQEFRVVQEGSPLATIAKKLVDSVKVTSSTEIELLLHSEEWHVNLIRRKRKTPYIIDDKFLVIVSSVWEYSVKGTESAPTKVVSTQECEEHREIEVRMV